MADIKSLGGLPIEALGGLLELMEISRPDSDMDAVETVNRARVPLERMCEEMISQRGVLENIHAQLNGTFSDNETVQASMHHSGMTLTFFPGIHESISKPLGELIDAYVKIASEYEIRVRGRLESLEALQSAEGYRDSPDSYENRRAPNARQNAVAIRAAKAAQRILKDSAGIYINAKLNLATLSKGVRALFVQYDKYLKDRFVKSQDDEKKGTVVKLIRDGEDEEPRAKYVKVKLYQQNPVLTDALLGMIDLVPEYKETPRTSRNRRSVKTERTLSRYAVEDAADKLVALSDPRFLSYLENPGTFFQSMGGALKSFYEVFSCLEPHHRAILSMPDVKLLTSSPELARKALSDDGVKTRKGIERLGAIDLDGIVQNPDDVSPDNRMETDLFKYREQLFDLFYQSMKRLSGNPDTTERRARAEAIIREAAELKYQMQLSTMTLSRRKLRQDKMRDNEYYVGRNGQVGQFYFERKPTPEVKIDEVVGASFGVAKGHLNEIIETGKYSRLMSITAPGGKVRSNILLIGPYGCGKTELGRAVCGDERVIGANVSAANVLTAWMHESVANVKRIYDRAVELREKGRDMKPVVLTMDEFNIWFEKNGQGSFADTDMRQIENIFLEVLDGMENYSGIITMAMTNKPLVIPHGVVRRFRYVDIVGQLTQDERKRLLSLYLEKRLPVAEGIQANYDNWAENLDHAPGDVVRKVVDELHFAMVPEFIRANPGLADKLERVLYRREAKEGRLDDRDIKYVRMQLQKYGCIATSQQVGSSLDLVLGKPHIRMQINDAKQVYRDAAQLLDQMVQASPQGFGLRPRDKIFEVSG